MISRFDDLLLGGLRELLGRDESIEVLAAGVEQRRMSVTLAGHHPDVAILDAGSLHRLSEVRELTVRHPATKIVLIAGDPSPAECAQVLAFGASACLDTATQARDVLSAIHLASRGIRLMPDVPAGGPPETAAPSRLLTAKEILVLPMLRDGRSNAQIALALGVGIETVRTHTRNLYRKLGVSSRRELLALARPPTEAPAEAPPTVRRRLGAASAARSRGHRSRPH